MERNQVQAFRWTSFLVVKQLKSMDVNMKILH